MVDSDFTPQELKTEEWRAIPGWEGIYEASTLGRLRNTHRHILRPSKAPNGYLRVVLMRGDRIRYTRSVHRLVIRTFVGIAPPDKPQVNHKDGVKTNNRDHNLEYCSPLENKEHARAMGLTPMGVRCGSVTHPESRPRGDRNPSRLHPERLARGEQHGNATLSDADVKTIRVRLASGEQGAALAREYLVGKSTISRIKLARERFAARR